MYGQRNRPRNLPTYDKQKLHFGFSLGLSEAHFNIQKNAAFALQDTLLGIGVNPLKGFDLHIISNLRMGEFFDLRFLPGLSFGQRDLVYTFKNDQEPEIREIQSTYLDFPLSIKYKSARINNYRMYVLGGAKYVYDLASKKKATDPDLIKLNIHDLYADAGVGVDFYLDFFKFSIELKGSWGITDVLYNKDLLHTKYIDGITSQKFMISLHFE